MKKIDILSLNNLTLSESSAQRFLLEFCWKNHQRFCPVCKNRNLYRLTDGRRRCGRCGYTFHDFSRRFLNRCALDARQWLWLLKLFALDVPPGSIASEMNLGYATILKALDTVRRAILAQALDAPKLYSAGVWPGPGNPKPATEMSDSPIFGIIELGGMAICDLLPDLDPASVLHFKLNFCLKTACIGHVVYTAPYKHYQALVACGPGLWPARYIKHADKRLPVDGSPFWNLAKQRLRLLRGVPASHFPLYLKECELRYNSRDQDLVPILAQLLCSFVPRPVEDEKKPPRSRPGRHHGKSSQKS
ncbi:MAG: transposase [Deltaproteobacteria bacterium]|nr:transposase [Deltaproteobacteria bacterium]